MKKRLTLLALFFCTLSIAAPLQDRKIDPAALSQLASNLGLSPNEDIVSQTQKYWLRKQERWDVAELPSDKRLLVIKWAEEQGFFSNWQPTCKSYDKAVILGATTRHMQKRLNYLKQLWDLGVRFKEVVWLTGDRPLDPSVDDFTKECNTEVEAAHIIWGASLLPEEMRTLPASFFPTPMKGANERPNTEDTIITWLKTSPVGSRLLFISDQPFCGYQFAVVKTNLPDEFLFDVVGPGIEPEKYPNVAAVTLDCIARWIYQEKLKEKRQGDEIKEEL